MARPDEFGEAMRFTDMVFRPGERGRRILQRQYPHAYRDEPAYARRLLILRHRGELVGCLAIHPMVLRLGAARVRAGGIGIVGAHPQRRGEGIMTALLEDALVRMRQAGQVVSVLGGDRQRYGHFGWENGGVRNVFHLTPRSLAKVPPAGRVALRRLPAHPEPTLCRRIQRLAASRPFGVTRALTDVPPLLVRQGKETWTVQAGRRFAYAVAGGQGWRARPYTAIHEFGGDPRLCLVLFRDLLGRSAEGRLSVVAGPNPDEVALLRPVSATWFRMSDGMINILDVRALGAALTPELHRRAERLGLRGHFNLEVDGVDGTAQRGSLELGGGARVPHRLRLDQRQAVSLLFGCLPLSEIAGDWDGVPAPALETLGGVLPLPLHIPSLSHI